MTTVGESLTCWKGQSSGTHTAGSRVAQRQSLDCSSQQHKHHSASHQCCLDSSAHVEHVCVSN